MATRFSCNGKIKEHREPWSNVNSKGTNRGQINLKVRHEHPSPRNVVVQYTRLSFLDHWEHKTRRSNLSRNASASTFENLSRTASRLDRDREKKSDTIFSCESFCKSANKRVWKTSKRNNDFRIKNQFFSISSLVGGPRCSRTPACTREFFYCFGCSPIPVHETERKRVQKFPASLGKERMTTDIPLFLSLCWALLHDRP